MTEESGKDVPRKREAATSTSLILMRWLASKTSTIVDESTVECGTPPPLEEPHCYTISSSDASEEHGLSSRLQVTRDTIRNLLTEHMRFLSGRTQLLSDLETYKVNLDYVKSILPTCKPQEINVLLLFSSFIGAESLIALFHQHGADLNSAEHAQGLTALHLAAFSDSLKIVQYLLRYGACTTTQRAHTAFHYAAFGNAKCVTRYFLSLDFPQVSPHSTETVLHAASRSASLEVLEILAPGNPYLNDLDSNGKAAVHYAAESGSPQCLKILLQASCKVDLKTKRGDTALHLAAEVGCFESLNLLLENASSGKEKNSRGQTALHLAARDHSLDCVEALLIKHACAVNEEDDDGRTALHLALGKSHVALDVVKQLLCAGAEINRVDKYGYTALHIAALNELSCCVGALIEKGADLSSRTKGGTSALSIVLRKTPGSLEAFRKKLDGAMNLQQPPNSASGELELRFDFNILLQHSGKTESTLLSTFVEEGYKTILEHPLCCAFLHLKWQKIRKYHTLGMLFYFFYVLSITSWVMTALAHDCFNEINGQVRGSCSSDTGIQAYLRSNPRFLDIERYVLLTMTGIEVFRKLASLPVYLSARRRLFRRENLVEWSVVFGVLTASYSYTGKIQPWQNHIGAFSVLCAWSNLMLMVGQLPVFGAYVAMFTSVQAQVLKLLLAYACLLAGFTASFCVLFPRSRAFSSPHTALVKVLVMMTGELGFEELFSQPDDHSGFSWVLVQFSAQISFVLFLLFVTIVLMNLLIGIAVHDIKGLQKTAGLARLVRQTKLIRDVETALFLSLLPMKLIRWTALIVPSPLRAVLSVRPLNPREKRLPKEVLSAAYKTAKEKRNLYDCCGRTTCSYATNKDFKRKENGIKEEVMRLKEICESNQKLIRDLIALTINKNSNLGMDKNESLT